MFRLPLVTLIIFSFCVFINLRAQNGFLSNNNEVSFGIGISKINVCDRNLSGNVFSLNLYGVTLVTGSTGIELDEHNKALYFHCGYSFPIVRYVSAVPLIGLVDAHSIINKFDYGGIVRFKVCPKKLWSFSAELMKTKYMMGVLAGIRWNMNL